MEVRLVLNGIWTVIGIHMLQLVSHVISMECYRCPVSVTKEECQQNQFLDLCITGYTTCFTQVKYAIGSRAILNVTKSCVDDTFCENERSKTENPNCDVLSEDNYDCVWCCHEDKCNENSAGHFLQGDYSAILVTMVIAISFHVLQLLSSSEGNLLSVGDR